MTDEQQEQRGWMDEVQVERAIVLQVLRDDHPERWTRAELEAEVSDFDPLTGNEALAMTDLGGVQTKVQTCDTGRDAVGSGDPT